LASRCASHCYRLEPTASASAKEAEKEEEQSMMTEIAAVIVTVLIVVYSIRTALSGMRGRPKSP
jgi:hypothetical protein